MRGWKRKLIKGRRRVKKDDVVGGGRDWGEGGRKGGGREGRGRGRKGRGG